MLSNVYALRIQLISRNTSKSWPILMVREESLIDIQSYFHNSSPVNFMDW